MVRKWMMTAFASLIAFTGFLNAEPQTASAAQYTFYASPTGSGATCSESAPCSLTGARNKVQTVNASMSDDIEVLLLGGTYALSSTFVLSAADSGSNGHYVIYKAAPGASPVISGGEKVTGWTQVSGTGRWKATVNLSDFRQLYVNGKRARRAATSAEVATKSSWYGTEDGYYVNANDIPTFARSQDLELIGHYEWRQYRLVVNDVVNNGSTKGIELKQPYFDWVRNINLNPNPGMPVAFENALELLDTPGEWYFNKSTQELQYMPLAGEDMATADVYAPKLEKLLEIKGSSISNKAHHIKIEGIAFRHGSWVLPSAQGASALQSTAMTDGTGAIGYMLPGNIEIGEANLIEFNKNIVEQMGANGLNLTNGVTNAKVVGNIFRDISGAAVNVGHWNHDFISSGEEVVEDNDIENNVLRDIAVEYWASAAITAYYVDNLNISHNDIKNASWVGISVGWGWGSVPTSTTARNNKIRYNKIENPCDIMGNDCAFIYTLGQQPDSTIHGNYGKNMNNRTHLGAAIYHDEGSQWYTDTDNVMETLAAPDATFPYPLSVHYHQSKNNSMNNLYTDTDATVEYDNWHFNGLEGWDTNNIIDNPITNKVVVTDGNWPTAARTIMNNAGLEPAYQYLLYSTAATGTNVALGGTASASSIYDGTAPASKGNDGSTATVWAGSGSENNSWWQVDLGAAYTIDRLEVVTRQDVDQPITRRNFEVRASNSSSFSSYTVLGSQGSTALPFQATWSQDVTDSTAYRYVRVVKTVTGEYSVLAEIRVFSPDTQAPTAPTSLSSPAKTSTTADLSWTASTDNVGVTGYDIYVNGAFNKSSTTTSTTVTGLAAGTGYSFTVKAKDASGNASAASSALSVVTLINVALGGTASASSIFDGTAPASQGNDGSIATVWAGSPSENNSWWQADLGAAYTINRLEVVTRQDVDQPITRRNFEVRASNNSSFSSYTVLGSQGSTALPYQATWSQAVTDSTAYRYVRVVKTVSGEYSVLADIRVLSPDTQAPTAPTSLSSPAKTSTSVSLTWTASTDNAGLAGYDIYVNGAFNKSSTTTSTTVAGLAAGTGYSFTVKAKDASGNASAASSALSVTTSTPTNVALGGTASASSVFDGTVPASNGKDGSTATVWAGSPSENNSWWQVDLGAAYTINRLEVVTRQDVDQPITRRNFEVRASNSSSFSSYTVLGSQGSTALPYQATWSQDVPDSTAYRYVRVVKTASFEYAVMAEIRVISNL